jgi:hypothetical protein
MVESLRNALDVFLSYIPQLIGAIIILIVGYFVAKILQPVFSRVLQAVGFDGWMERGGIKQFFDQARTRETPATVLGKLVFWLVFIIAITMAADALGIQQVSQVLSQLIAYIPSIIAAILILLGAAALAAAIAFGFGAQGVARDIVEKAYARRDEAKQTVQQDGSGGSTSTGATRPGIGGLRSVVRRDADLTARPQAIAVGRGHSTGTPPPILEGPGARIAS